MGKRIAMLAAVALGASLVVSMPSASARRPQPRVIGGRGTASPSFVAGIRSPGRTGSPASVARSALARDRSLYKIDNPARDLRTIDVIRGRRGLTTVRFGQMYRGLPVFGAQYLVHMKRTSSGLRASSANGHYFTELSVPTSARVPVAAAVRIALRALAPLKGARVARRGLTVLPMGGSGILAFHLTVTGVRFGNPVRQEVFVNARTGAVTLSYNNLQADAVPAVSVHGDEVPLQVASAGTTHAFIDTSRTFAGQPTGHLVTCDAHSAPVFPCDEPLAIVERGRPINGHATEVGGVDAHWGAGKVFSFYKALGRNSLDDHGMDMLSSVNLSDGAGGPLFNAFWDGSQVNYGNPGNQVFPLSGDLDVVAHEFTHGVTQFSAELVYLNESGAMNEAYSDYFGEAVDTQVSGTSLDSPESGEIGEDLCMSPPPDPEVWQCPLRDMNDGRTTADHTFFLVDIDGGGVHINSTIYSGALWDIREAFWDARVGGSAQAGAHRADLISYTALSQFLDPFASFYTGRLATVEAAKSLGASDTEISMINEAFDAHRINATWDAGGTIDSTILRRNVAPLGLTFSPPQAAAGRYILGDYADKTQLCCVPEQIFVGRTDGRGAAREVGEFGDPDTLNDELPDIGGRLAVWAHLSASTRHFSVHGRLLGSPKVMRIAEEPGAWHWFPSATARRVAWERLDLATGETDIYTRVLGGPVRAVTTAPGDQLRPQVFGSWVAYWDVSEQTPSVTVRNMATGERFIFSGGATGVVGPPALGGCHLYWYQDSEFFSSARGAGVGSIRRARLGADSSHSVVAGNQSYSPVWVGLTFPPVPSANARWVTYHEESGFAAAGVPPNQQGRDVWIAAAAENAVPRVVTRNRGDQAYPQLDSPKGKRVVWLDTAHARTDLMMRIPR